MVQKKQPPFRFHDIFQFMSSLYEQDLHAKRIYSLANATLGVMTGAALDEHDTYHRCLRNCLINEGMIKVIAPLISPTRRWQIERPRPSPS
jgi:hypothetical protein